MNKQKPIAYLLSFPRSGNTWVRYCVEFFTKCSAVYNTTEIKITDNLLNDLNINLKISKTLLKMHAMNDLRFKNSCNFHKLIILVRNPFEAIIRDIKNKDNNLVIKRTNKYMHILQVYDKWQTERLLIYYEDLVLKPKTTIIKILKFLKLDISAVNEFMQNYEKHKKICLEYYNKEESGSITRGDVKKLIYHSKSTSINNLNIVEEMLNKQYKNLTKKYLIRYVGGK